jgi:thioredoxin 1
MATKELTAENFKETIEKDGIVLVDFWASWCGPCRMFAPTFEKASEKHPDVVFGKVDTEAQEELAAAFEIRSIPTLMVFRDRVLLFNQAGALPGEVLEELVTKVKGLDMAEVRRQIEEHEKEHAQEHAEKPT